VRTSRPLGITLGVAVLLGACARGDRSPAPAHEAPASPPRVLLESKGGRRSPVTVEIVRTEAERARGLMHRASLGTDAGMLFIFEETGDHAFWMKNTLIPLDMIFIGEDGRVTGIVARAAPGSLEPRLGGPSRFVLEVNGGWAEAHGISAGDTVRFEGVPFP
jgi:uncharacterized membrane protein (UPF0127 family)